MARPCSRCSPIPQRADWRDHILCAYYGGEYLYTQRIAITDRFKYVFNGFDYDEMYDLERDPDEMHNVAADADYETLHRRHAGAHVRADGALPRPLRRLPGEYTSSRAIAIAPPATSPGANVCRPLTCPRPLPIHD